MNLKIGHIDNVKSGVYLLIVFIPLSIILYKNGVLGHNLEINQFILISTVTYLISNRFFQPDLDVYPNFPGYKSFPLGGQTGRVQKVLTSIIGLIINKYHANAIAYRLISIAILPFSLLWRALWTPFSMLFTHRGVIHWPIVGYSIRIGYLIGLVELFFLLSGHFSFFSQDTYLLFLKARCFLLELLPWNVNLRGLSGVLAYSMMFSDLQHIVVDFIDSTLRGKRFCPKKIPRGLLIRVLQRRFK